MVPPAFTTIEPSRSTSVTIAVAAPIVPPSVVEDVRAFVTAALKLDAVKRIDVALRLFVATSATLIPPDTPDAVIIKCPRQLYVLPAVNGIERPVIVASVMFDVNVTAAVLTTNC